MGASNIDKMLMILLPNIDDKVDIINLNNDKNIRVNKVLLNKQEINSNNKWSLVKTIALFIVLLILIGVIFIHL